MTITKNGRERLVLLSVDEYRRLKDQAGGSPSSEQSKNPTVDIGSLTKALKDALKPHAGAIKTAFVYGSFAKGVSTARSDIDLMVIGDDFSYSDLYAAAQDVELKLGRKVSPTFLSPVDWRRKAAQKGTFIQKLGGVPKIFIVGSEKQLKAPQRA